MSWPILASACHALCPLSGRPVEQSLPAYEIGCVRFREMFRDKLLKSMVRPLTGRVPFPHVLYAEVRRGLFGCAPAQGFLERHVEVEDEAGSCMPGNDAVENICVFLDGEDAFEDNVMACRQRAAAVVLDHLVDNFRVWAASIALRRQYRPVPVLLDECRTGRGQLEETLRHRGLARAGRPPEYDESI